METDLDAVLMKGKLYSVQDVHSKSKDTWQPHVSLGSLGNVSRERSGIAVDR